MRHLALCLFLLAPFAAFNATAERDGKAIWDSRCEECHGDPAEFAGKYLWNIEGQLQGQHHINDLALFMGNHYIPDHEIERIDQMLLGMANSPARFTRECGECHADARELVTQAFWLGENGITLIASGSDVTDYLVQHRALNADDAAFYVKLFSRIASKPQP
jgi:hypothetical protein